jgi:hypothetical protein
VRGVSRAKGRIRSRFGHPWQIREQPCWSTYRSTGCAWLRNCFACCLGHCTQRSCSQPPEKKSAHSVRGGGARAVGRRAGKGDKIRLRKRVNACDGARLVGVRPTSWAAPRTGSSTRAVLCPPRRRAEPEGFGGGRTWARSLHAEGSTSAQLLSGAQVPTAAGPRDRKQRTQVDDRHRVCSADWVAKAQKIGPDQSPSHFRERVGRLRRLVSLTLS